MVGSRFAAPSRINDVAKTAAAAAAKRRAEGVFVRARTDIEI
jgi:hypothetical protein